LQERSVKITASHFDCQLAKAQLFRLQNGRVKIPDFLLLRTIVIPYAPASDEIQISNNGGFNPCQVSTVFSRVADHRIAISRNDGCFLAGNAM